MGFFVSPGWGASGIILNTTDGGASWLATELETSPLRSVCFPDSLNGYAVGLNGKILKTSDRGTSWQAQNSGTTSNLNSVFFTDSHTGYIVGDQGTILKTTNGGYGFGINDNRQTNSLKYGLTIYPNPATEKITIERSEPGINANGTVSIYGMAGREMIKQQVHDTQAEIDVSSLPTGIYFIRLMNSKKTAFGKFVKE
ncbi:MAG: T9SS type A sorting domain-containing protein [Bacteroidetes bacterium]|nr:T9SS type A sorting domain-containing protein [Bacteroidota bacterium]